MKKKTIFGNWEASAIIINLICTKIFLNFPRMAAETGGTAAWLFTIFIAALAFLGFTVIQILYKPFEGKDLLDIAELAAGNPGRVLAGLVIILGAGWCATAYMRVFSENMKLISLTTSPLSFVELFFTACLAAELLAWKPCPGFMPFGTFYSLGLSADHGGVVNYIDLGNLLPILETGPKRFL